MLAPVLALPLTTLTTLPGATDASAAARPTVAAQPAPPAAPQPQVVPAGPDHARPAIRLRDASLDTGKGGPPPPPTLAAGPTSGRQLRLVQFSGPVRPSWYAGLARLGTVVTYVPDNSYLVWTTGSGAAALERQADTTAYTRYSGPFDPYYRLAPPLRGKQAPDAGPVDVTVQAVSGPDGDAALSAVSAGREVLSPAYDLGGLVTTSVRVPVGRLDEIASMAPVVNVEPYVAPTLDDEVQDQLLAGNVQTVGGKTVPTGPGYLAWLAEKGFPTDPAAYPKVVVVDDGIDNGSTTPVHADFYELGNGSDNNSRLLSNANCTTDATANAVGGHGNLNAGIVGGYSDRVGATFADAGGYQRGLGVSPYGRLGGVKIFANSGPYSISGCSGTDAGVVARVWSTGAGISTNSWGANVGGAYDASARAYDLLTRDASSVDPGDQELLHVFSAGNAGSGANTIGSPGTAKNVLTVGATENVRDQGTPDGCATADGDSDSDIATFSSRGPTDDGRVKPELVAAGTHVQGPASQDPGFNGTGVCGPAAGQGNYYPVGQTLYTWSSGTSHSTPAVAGAASLLQNYYGRVLAPGATASPAMLKALLANTPRYLDGGLGTGDVLPSNSQGYGVPDLGALFEDAPHRLVSDQAVTFTASGQSRVRAGTVHDTTQPVRVTLAWTDAAGPTVGNAYVNDLDLEVTAGGLTYRGNVFGTDGLSATGGSADAKNNLESVFLPAGTSGPVSVRVVATNIAGDALPGSGGPLEQDFALTVSNTDETPTAVAGAAGLTFAESDDAGTTVDPGEVVTVEASVTDTGTLELPAGTGTLTVVSGSASVLQGSSGFGVITPGQTVSNRRAYQVRIDTSPACSTAVVLEHTYTAGGQSIVERLRLSLGSPVADVTATSTDVPKAIPDNTPAGVTSTLVVPPSDDTLSRLVVRLAVTHTFDGDLSATVTTPSGTVLTLFSRIGGAGNSGDNLMGTEFSDAAAAAPAAGGAPYTGLFRPVTSFATVDGQPLAGTWTLKVSDNANLDTGTLTSWGITAQPPARVCGPASPSVVVTPPAPVGEGGVLDVPVTLLDPDGGTETVTLGTTDGTATAPDDFTATPVTLTWNPGDPATQHVLVPVVADGVAEPEETFTVAATAATVPVSAPVTARILALAPTVAISPAASVTESGGSLQFPVTLADPDPDTTYSVQVDTTGGTATTGVDHAAVSRTLTWSPGDPATQLVEVPVTDDGSDEPDETVEVTVSSPTNAVLATATATGTILDDDLPTTPPVVKPVVTVKAAKVKEGDRGTRRLVFRVVLDRAGTAPVGFTWRTKGLTAKAGKDFRSASGRLTIPAGSLKGTLRVTVVGDRLDERNERLALTLGKVVGGVLARASATGTIVDDD
ncbi:Calx-beta domain-containing protein [Nocardioides rubriscoriae]|uniref:Calx-beta domain-containing protein n=1 Tax=Nocardioides rubriscoriae TaxID=642762 RepID=UPI0011DFAE9E|nr:Calx-beta domain-containing protein [Nocardioides rubriscoriae]